MAFNWGQLKKIGRRYAVLFSLLPFSEGQAAVTEQSAGLIVGKFQPQYTKELKGDPLLPTHMLVTGVHATFVKKGLLFGARGYHGTTNSTAPADKKSNLYTAHYMGFVVGSSFEWGFMDFTLANTFGLGKFTYSTFPESNPVGVEASYVGLEPHALFGFPLATNFKVSLGGSYQAGYAYEVHQYGPTQVLAKPLDKVKFGGMLMFAQISFGFMNY